MNNCVKFVIWIVLYLSLFSDANFVHVSCLVYKNIASQKIQEETCSVKTDSCNCIFSGPEPPEPGLPNYPGFEKDVFGVVKDYFLSQEQPLVPYSLYDIVTNVFGELNYVIYCHITPANNS